MNMKFLVIDSGLLETQTPRFLAVFFPFFLALVSGAMTEPIKQLK
jgi:hypothetical protein